MPKTPVSRKSTDEYLMAGWSKQYGREIGLEEVREINANLSAFVDVMERIDRYLSEKRETEKNRFRD